MPAFVSRRAPASVPLTSRRVRVLADQMLAALGLSAVELSVHLTDDATMIELNRRYRGQNRSTDVLSFALDDRDGAEGPEQPPRALGDVVISIDTAMRQANRRRTDLIAEVTWLLSHGLLHLLGYDHQTPRQRRSMDQMSRQLIDAAAARASLKQIPAVGRVARRRPYRQARGCPGV